MAKLKAAGLVRSRREGVWIYYSLREDLSPETRRLLEPLLAEGLGSQPAAS